jgi:hypothetical protein
MCDARRLENIACANQEDFWNQKSQSATLNASPTSGCSGRNFKEKIRQKARIEREQG